MKFEPETAFSAPAARSDERRRRAGIDWAATAMGPMSDWPHALLFAIDLIDLARQPMVVTWGTDRLMFYNDAYVPILDGKPSAQGQPMHEVFAEAWDVIADNFLRAEAGESVYFEDFKSPLTRWGRTEDTWWTVSCSPLPSTTPDVKGVLCVVHETTRLHTAEQAARLAREELGRITDLVPSLLWKADGFGRTIWQNGRLKALAAETDANATNIWRKLMHPDDIEALLVDLSAAKIARRPFAKAVRIKVAADEFRWHQVRSEPVIGETGDLIGWYGVGADIQDIRDAVVALEEGNALFSQFVANSSALLWVMDLDTLAITPVSPNFADIWPEVTPDQTWTWQAFLSCVHDADRPARKIGLEKVAAGEAVIDKFRVEKQGALRTLEGTTFPIRSSDGRIRRIGGILQDVTRRVALVVHLIDQDRASQNKWSHALRRQGLEVVTFDTVDTFAAIAAGLARGPVVFRFSNDPEPLERLSVLMKTSVGQPWMVIRDADRPAQEAVGMMKLGAVDVIDADASIQTVAAAIKAVASEIEPRPEREAKGALLYRLTRREHEIAQALVTGGTNKSIAKSLGLSPRTVESHRGRLMERLNVRTLAELVALVTSASFSADVQP